MSATRAGFQSMLRRWVIDSEKSADAHGNDERTVLARLTLCDRVELAPRRKFRIRRNTLRSLSFLVPM